MSAAPLFASCHHLSRRRVCHLPRVAHVASRTACSHRHVMRSLGTHNCTHDPSVCTIALTSRHLHHSAVIAAIRYARSSAASSMTCAPLHSSARHVAILRSYAHTLAIIHSTTRIALLHHSRCTSVIRCSSRHRRLSAATHHAAHHLLHALILSLFESRFAGRIWRRRASPSFLGAPSSAGLVCPARHAASACPFL